jgi:peptidoglycan/LPS O-acetylase OafA/YrhL
MSLGTDTANPSWTAGVSPGLAATSRSSAIDVIKGLAIVSVICLHTFSVSTLHQIAALFHIWQAVPVFIFLMGVNGASSLRHRDRRSLGELYSREYLSSRFDRIFVPYLVAFLAVVLLDVVRNTDQRSAATLVVDLLTGELPIGGPGNYFITLLFQFVLVFPLVYWGLRRRLLLTVAVCLSINVAFELLASRGGAFAGDPYLYEACILHYIFLMALGGALSGVEARRLLGSWWLWCGAMASIVYLAFVQIGPPAMPLSLAGWEGSSYAAAFYPALLVLLGMAVLPARARTPPAQGLAELGRASYHIFLLQIVWFALLAGDVGSWGALPLNLTVTLLAGLAFYKVMALMPLPSMARLTARRRATLAGLAAGL